MSFFEFQKLKQLSFYVLRLQLWVFLTFCSTDHVSSLHITLQQFAILDLPLAVSITAVTPIILRPKFHFYATMRPDGAETRGSLTMIITHYTTHKCLSSRFSWLQCSWGLCLIMEDHLCYLIMFVILLCFWKRSSFKEPAANQLNKTVTSLNNFQLNIPRW